MNKISTKTDVSKQNWDLTYNMRVRPGGHVGSDGVFSSHHSRNHDIQWAQQLRGHLRHCTSKGQNAEWIWMKQSKQTNLNHPEPINPGTEPTNHNNKEVSSCYRAISNKERVPRVPRVPSTLCHTSPTKRAPTTLNCPGSGHLWTKDVTIPIPIKGTEWTELPLLSLSASWNSWRYVSRHLLAATTWPRADMDFTRVDRGLGRSSSRFQAFSRGFLRCRYNYPSMFCSAHGTKPL